MKTFGNLSCRSVNFRCFDRDVGTSARNARNGKLNMFDNHES